MENPVPLIIGVLAIFAVFGMSFGLLGMMNNANYGVTLFLVGLGSLIILVILGAILGKSE